MKKKISFTLDADIADEIEKYFYKLTIKAIKEKKKPPKIANIYEDIVRRGWRATRK